MPAVTIPMASSKATTAPTIMIPNLAPTPRGGAGKGQDDISTEGSSPDRSTDAGSTRPSFPGSGMSIDASE